MNYGYQIVKNGLVMNLDVIDVNSFVANQTTWKDLTGKNYGRLIRDSTFCNVKDSSSLFFNGIDSSLFIGNTSLVSGNTQTISFWFKKHYGVIYTTGTDGIFKGYNFSDNGWSIYLNNSNIIKFQTLINSVIYEVSGQQIENGIWYNVAISFNSNGFLKGYLNGVLVGAVSIPAFTTIAPYYVAISNFSAYIANVLFYNRVLSDLEVLQNYNVFAKRFVVKAEPSLITSGLVMNLDASNPSVNSSSGFAWYDLSGYNNHGSIHYPSYRKQSGGNFLFESASSDYVTVANSASLNATTQTISVWYYMTVSATSQILITKHNTADQSNGYKIFGSGSIEMKVSTTTTNAGLNLVPIDDWYLLTATFSANSFMRTYVNGVASGSAVVIGNLVLSTNAIRIGGSPSIASGYFLGHIAQVTIYNRLLSAAEILQNFNATKTKFGY